MGRYLAGFALVMGCGAAPVPVAVVPDEPPSGSNTNAPPPAPVTAIADAVPQVARVAELPSIAGVYLWCEMPGGRACAAATAALGTGPKDPLGLPPSVLSVEDLANDCDEPTIATVARRLSVAFPVTSSGWRDQSGSYLDATTLGQMYQAGGCINDSAAGAPIAKISAGDGSAPRVYLVRVWEVPVMQAP